MELLKLLSTSQIVAQIISFLILFFVMRVFLWKRFLKILDDRKNRIASEFKGIESAKAEVERLKADYDAKIRDIDETARVRIQEAIAEGRKVAEAIRDDSAADSRKMIESAKAAIQEELSNAREKLKEDIVDLTVDIAGKVIEEKFSSEDNKKLVKDFMERADRVR